jgi:hypothetical protein
MFALPPSYKTHTDVLIYGVMSYKKNMRKPEKIHCYFRYGYVVTVNWSRVFCFLLLFWFLFVCLYKYPFVFTLSFTLSWMHYVTDCTRTIKKRAHFIWDTIYTERIIRNIQCIIIKAFVESSTYPICAQQCFCMSWGIRTNGKWYHCVKKGNVFYYFPREKNNIKNPTIWQTLRITLT